MLPMDQPARSLGLRFSGRASEYFRIWIIGVALSLLTFGVYSAWAKVRSEQYFHRHTWLDGSSFEYLAGPRELLRGRLLLALCFSLLFALQVVYAPFALITLAIVMLITPWVVMRSVGFRAQSTSFRNVSLSFRSTLPGAYRIFLTSYLGTLATCGLAYPGGRWRRLKYVIEGLRYGDAPLGWRTTADAFYRMYLRAAILWLPVVGLIFARAVYGLQGRALFAARIVPYAFVFLGTIYLRAAAGNLLYGGLTIGKHRLRSSQRFWPLLWIYLTNTLAVLGTVGLAIPWAKVRLTRYRIESLTLEAHGGLAVSSVLGSASRRGYGDAAADLGGIDLGVG
jgi:uncharacterized membrane protein YjgN (DUF898 family)